MAISSLRRSSRARTHKPPRVFLSYSRRDRELAREVAAGLRAEDIEVFLDLESVQPGENIALVHGKALEKAEAAVVLLSDDSMQSTWARHEWEYLIGTRRFAGRVLAVLTPGTDEEKLPWIWKRLHHVRPGSDGRLSASTIAKAMQRLLAK